MFFISLRAYIFLFTISCYSCLVLPIDKKNITYTRIYYSSNKNTTTKLPGSLVNSQDFARNLSSLGNKFAPTTKGTTEYTLQGKISHKGSFTKKQYEIINMFWGKTKVYLDVEATRSPQKEHNNLSRAIFDLNEERNAFIFSPASQTSQYSTPSYIEFYYSDEINDRTTTKGCVNRKCQLKGNKYNAKLHTLNSSFIVFRIKPMPKTEGNHTKAQITNANTSDYHIIVNSTLPMELRRKSTESLKVNESKHVFIAKRCMTKPVYQPTTEYDKIKFFERYDKLTPTPVPIVNYKVKEDKASQYKNDHKNVTLMKFVKSFTHKKPRHAKKHITDSYKNQGVPCFNKNEGYKKPTFFTMQVIPEEQNKTDASTTTKSYMKRSSKRKQKATSSYTNRSVSWSEYPYAAVYVYEPLQIHCDAVSISEHWLIASGSCLSRLNKSPLFGQGRSAFVAYCGDRWWVPERVSYVKFSGVHPWYHPTDRTRKHLYNIGVIQVVTSMMSACSEWAPVSLMSHQFTASRGGSEALALGWGLDRFDTRYTSLELPKMSLMVYKGLVFSDSCPGNTGYGKMKQFDDGGGVSNVYCLSLPPYTGEDEDPVHGSLLHIGGKLMALYLQEERRPSGEQSAQYTGIWRLIPWVMEMAKEPLEAEAVEI